jgi:hypothetical protein
MVQTEMPCVRRRVALKCFVCEFLKPRSKPRQCAFLLRRALKRGQDLQQRGAPDRL